jgi:hypothetical protein
MRMFCAEWRPFTQALGPAQNLPQWVKETFLAGKNHRDTKTNVHVCAVQIVGKSGAVSHLPNTPSHFICTLKEVIICSNDFKVKRLKFMNYVGEYWFMKCCA